MNNVLTASRMFCAMRCLRQHFWTFEIGLRKTEVAHALRFGGAWARAMEARWNGKTYDEALAIAIPEGIDLDDYSCAILSALLAAYYDYYGEREDVGKLYPEVQFGYGLGLGFTVEGKMDGLGSMNDGLSVIIEAKTTGDSLEPDSDYWLRLTFNMQVYQYIMAARHHGWDISKVFYDVTRKPSIRPKTIDDLDGNKLKIVIDANTGERIYCTKKEKKTTGKGKEKKVEVREVTDYTKPRQSGDKDKGWIVKCHVETPDEFCDRLYRDALKRPSFYFARREVPVLDQQLESFERQRLAIAQLILSLRENERLPIYSEEFVQNAREIPDAPRDPEAWPRNVSENTCNFCSFKSFCLQNISVDLNSPPAGFTIEPFNPELNEHDYNADAQDASASTE